MEVLRTDRLILRSSIAEDGVWDILLKDSSEIIGSIGLHDDERQCLAKVKMLDYVLAEQYWGQGIMTEAVREILHYAFQHLKIKVISIIHNSSNISSQRVAEKNGFQYEGILRPAEKLLDGTSQELRCYSLSRKEWQNHYNQGKTGDTT